MLIRSDGMKVKQEKDKNIIIGLKSNTDRYFKLISALRKLGNFENDIFVFVDEDYNVTNMIHTKDIDGVILSFYSHRIRDIRKQNYIFVENNNLIDCYNFSNNKIINDMNGYRINENSVLYLIDKPYVESGQHLFKLKTSNNMEYVFNGYSNCDNTISINDIVNSLRECKNIDFFTFYKIMKDNVCFTSYQRLFVLANKNDINIGEIFIKNGIFDSLWIKDTLENDTLIVNYKNNYLDINSIRIQNVLEEDMNLEFKDIVCKSRTLIKNEKGM